MGFGITSARLHCNRFGDSGPHPEYRWDPESWCMIYWTGAGIYRHCLAFGSRFIGAKGRMIVLFSVCTICLHGGKVKVRIQGYSPHFVNQPLRYPSQILQSKILQNLSTPSHLKQENDLYAIIRNGAISRSCSTRKAFQTKGSDRKERIKPNLFRKREYLGNLAALSRCITVSLVCRICLELSGFEF